MPNIARSTCLNLTVEICGESQSSTRANRQLIEALVRDRRSAHAKNEARRIAENIAKLTELLRKPQTNHSKAVGLRICRRLCLQSPSSVLGIERGTIEPPAKQRSAVARPRKHTLSATRLKRRFWGNGTGREIVSPPPLPSSSSRSALSIRQVFRSDGLLNELVSHCPR
jgi:hypothetical protein